jgi:glycyl-tRNA synthetase beta chain
MARELLLEVGTEELPAGYIPPAVEELAGSARKAFEEARIGCEKIETFGTPRRLVLRATGVAEKQEDLVQEQQGPAKQVAFDEQGQPTKAARGFAESRGLSLEDLEVRETPKGAYVFARVFTAGRATDEILPDILPQIIVGLSFPKTMRWGTGDLRFARPIRWLLALLDERVISFSLNGVTSGNRTHGHRQLSPGPFTVPSAVEYWRVMDRAGIVVDAQVRRKKIWQGLVAAADEQDGRPLPDEKLLDAVTYLVEVPTPLCGPLEKRFLSLPREVLITALSEHQKCFVAVDENDRLLPLFLAVSNGDPQQAGVILSGFGKVLTARLEDARFFFQEDRKTPLSDRVEALKAVVFQEDLGTMHEKTERIVALTEHLGGVLNLPPAERKAVARAALLCKADLVTLMVAEKEFSGLQGYMGQQYALASGESPEVAQAIFEHYLPRFAEDALPRSLPGSLVAAADKTDTIVGCFGIGLIPTGSQDPYALRRSALGVVRILLQHDLKVNLPDLVDRALVLLKSRIKVDPETVREQVVAFFRQRVESQLVDRGLDADVVDAVLAADDRVIVDALRRARAVQSFRKREKFTALVQGARRVANILRDQDVSGDLDAKLLCEEAEKDLYEIHRHARQDIARHIDAGEYQAALEATLKLVDPVDTFFERILVMAENPKLRANRLRLLALLKESFTAVADYSRVVLRGEDGSAAGEEESSVKE